TDLVGHDAELLPLRGQAQHGQQEIGSVQAVYPSRAEDQMVRGGGLDLLFPGELALAVDAQRCRGVVLTPGARASAVEYIVGREMHQAGSARRTHLGEARRSVAVDQERRVDI